MSCNRLKKSWLKVCSCLFFTGLFFILPIMGSANEELSLEKLDSLNIQDCVRLAKENNYTLQIAQLKTKQALALKNEVRSSFFPQVSLEGVIDNNNRSLSGELTQFQDFHATKALGINANLGLWDFGCSWNRFKASKVRLKAVSMQKDETFFEVEEQVKIAYLKVLEKEKLVQVVQASLNTLKQQHMRSKDLFEQGHVKKTDVLAVQVQLSEKEKKLLKVKNDALSHRMYLNRLIGLPFFEMISLEDVKEFICHFSFQEALDYALEHRKDLLALHKQLEALRLDKRATQLGRAPQFYAFANGNYSSDRSSASVGIGMQMPIYEGGLRSAQVQKIDAQIEELKALIEDFNESIALEIKNTSLQFEEIQNSLVLDKESISLAQNNLSDSMDLYNQGLFSINDTLYAEDQLTFVKMNYFSNLYRYHIACAHLVAITGGFPLDLLRN